MNLMVCVSVNSKIFWFGDLNYRLNMLDAEVRKLIDLKRWDELVKSDQVRRYVIISDNHVT